MDLTTLVVVVVLGVLDVVVHRVPARAYLPTCLVASAALLVWASALGLTWSDLGLGRGTWVSGVVWGLGGSALVAGAVATGVLLPRTRGLLGDERGAAASRARLLWETGVRLPWGTVLLEEIAFRGLLLAVVLEASGNVWAVVVTSVCFGLWHVVPSLGRGREVAAATTFLEVSGRRRIRRGIRRGDDRRGRGTGCDAAGQRQPAGTHGRPLDAQRQRAAGLGRSGPRRAAATSAHPVRADNLVADPGPRSSGDRAPPSGGGSVGSNPTGGTDSSGAATVSPSRHAATDSRAHPPQGFHQAATQPR